MPNVEHLCAWLCNHLGELRLPPDMVTETASGTVRFRWHDLAPFGDAYYGVGVDLDPGPTVGEVWIYGHKLEGVRLFPYRAPVIPHVVQASLRSILVAHLGDQTRDWGRGAELYRPAAVARGVTA